MHSSRTPSVAPRRDVAAPRRRATHLAVRALALPLILVACRADGVTAPEQTAQQLCRTACGPDGAAPAPNAAIVITPLEDAATRIVPHMSDARTRADLAPVLDELRRELLAGRIAAARLALARAYDAVAMAEPRLADVGGAGIVLDLADLSAVRLSLVPASSALGVAVP